MPRLVLIVLFAVFALGSCTGDPSPAQRGSAPAPVEAITLAELGIDDWPVEQIPAPPGAPEVVDAAEFARAAEAVRLWAQQAATAPETVGKGLPAQLVAAIDAASQDQEAAELARGSVLDSRLDVRDRRMTAAWGLVVQDQAVQLSLQTRTAYEVQAPDGPVRVIGVLRTQGVVLSPKTQDWGTVTGWQEFGAADCALILDGHLTPGGDVDDQLSDLAVFARAGRSREPISPDLPPDQRIDEDFRQACEAGRV